MVSDTPPLFKIVCRKSGSKWFQSLLRKSNGITTFFTQFFAHVFAQRVATLVQLLLASARQLLPDVADATFGICGIHQGPHYGRADDDVTWWCSPALWPRHGQRISPKIVENTPELKAKSSVRPTVVHVWAVRDANSNSLRSGGKGALQGMHGDELES